MAYAIVRSAGNTVCYTTMFIPGDAGMNYYAACAEVERINEAFARIAELEAELMKKIEMESFWARHANNLESSVIPTMKKDYEARVAELEAQIGVLFDTIKRGEYESSERAESDAANFEQLSEGYVSAQARITELEILLDKAQNEIIMESGERAAWQVSCAEMEKQMHVKDTYIQNQHTQIASLTEALNDSRRREVAKF